MRLSRVFIAVAVIALAFVLPGHDNVSANADNYNSGLMAMKTGNLQEAIVLFTRAIEANPNDHRFYNDRGVAYKRSGDMNKALADYSKALELKPDYTNALNNRGVVHLQQGAYDEALKDFNEALKFGGIEGKIYTNMGLARARKGDHSSAIKDFDVAVSFRPLDYRSFLFMGESLEQIGDREKALKMYQVAMGLIADPEVVSQLEKKIAALEKLHSGSSSLSRPGTVQNRSTEKISSKQVDSAKKTSPNQALPKREIVLASPPVESEKAPEKPKPLAVAPRIENVQEIENMAREKALRSFSNPAAEIFKQGIEFIQKSDSAKALVRFEDARQLEKRKRNALAVAWCQLYICRLYNSMGENAKASENCEQSVKIFNSLKAHDETSLALIELGNIRKGFGSNDQASDLYVKAAQEARLAGRKILDPDSPVLALPLTDGGQQLTKEVKTDPSKSVTPQKQIAAPVVMNLGSRVDSKPAKQVELAQKQDSTKDNARRRPEASLDKVDSVGRGPVLWGADGPRSQIPKAPAENRNHPGVATKLSAIESKLGPDKLLPEASDRLASDAPKPPGQTVGGARATEPVKHSHGLESIAAVQNREQDLRGKQERLSGKSPVDNATSVSHKSIEDDLSELRKLRKSGDQKQMIVALERLAEKYSRTDQYQKALSCLNIALAFREKNDFRQNEEIALNQRGLINEKLGNLAKALEDYTRALFSSNPRSRDTEKILESKSRSLAAKMGLEAEQALENLKRLWKARSTGDMSEESKAFYNLAKIYSQAQKFDESLNYFDKSSASLMTEKSRVLEKLGRFEQAQKEMDQALETFKQLDYSQYLNMMRHSGKQEKISRH